MWGEANYQTRSATPCTPKLCGWMLQSPSSLSLFPEATLNQFDCRLQLSCAPHEEMLEAQPPNKCDVSGRSNRVKMSSQAQIQHDCVLDHLSQIPRMAAT